MADFIPPRLTVNKYDSVRSRETNEINQKHHIKPQSARSMRRQKGKASAVLKTLFWFLSLAAVFLVAIVGYRFYRVSHVIFVKEPWVSSEQKDDADKAFLKGESIEPTNILLLGMGGEGHDGPYLTDTVILMQIRPDIKAVSMTSIPRDTWVNNSSKINGVFPLAFKNHDYAVAGKAIRETVEKMSGLSIPYFATIDFQGFVKAIDLVGGVEVNVENGFTDYTYPDNNNGYLPPVTFEPGKQTMTGKRALIFARSRHANNSEGSDFARSRRQQLVIQAFKEKVVALGLIKDIGTIYNLVNTFADRIHTNLTPDQVLKLYTFGKELDRSRIVSQTLDPSTGLKCDTREPQSGAYIIENCDGVTAADIQAFFKDSFKKNALKLEDASVFITDTTVKKKLSQNAKEDLTSRGVKVSTLNNVFVSPSQNILYVKTEAKPETRAFLEKTFNAASTNLPPPGFDSLDLQGDFLLILVKDYVRPPVVKKATYGTLKSKEPAKSDQKVITNEPFNSDQ